MLRGFNCPLTPKGKSTLNPSAPRTLITLWFVWVTLNLMAVSIARSEIVSPLEQESISHGGTSSRGECAEAATTAKEVQSGDQRDDLRLRMWSTPEDSSKRNVIVIGFVGGFVRRDDPKHPEVRFAAYLRDRYPSIHAEAFGNHHGQKALHCVVRLLDTDHDGVLTSAERARATIIIYGHSWGATETAIFARELGQMGIPVMLTIQIDTIAKPGHNGHVISPNVASAINFYQTRGRFMEPRKSSRPIQRGRSLLEMFG